MNVAILGFAGQGQSSYQYWSSLGHDITICDKSTDTQLPDGANAQLGDKYLNDLNRFDLLIRTPALHPKSIQSANPNCPDILDKVWSNTNEFFKVCPTKNIIGVTGTKGKGTTASLIAKMLQKAGFTVHIGGNIGTPPLDLLSNNIQEDDWVVLELANFQLIDIKHSPSIGVCLMVVPEHMDWHTDLQEYINAKKQMFKYQNSDDVAIYYAKNDISKSIVEPSLGQKIPYMEAPGAIIKDNQVIIDNVTISEVKDIKLLGNHNWQNICAAVTAVWQVSKDNDELKRAISEFNGLPHRLEFVRRLNEVNYYNDSFAATPEAAAAAISAIPGNKILILGGFDRGLKLDNLISAIRECPDILHILLIGQSRTRLADELVKSGVDSFTVCEQTTMAEIVKLAVELSEGASSVVLSPGFPSFDMFKNFEDRGLQYKQSVMELS